jgi:hypothetical protein
VPHPERREVTPQMYHLFWAATRGNETVYGAEEFVSRGELEAYLEGLRGDLGAALWTKVVYGRGMETPE